jgi:hypothetical protein
MKKSDARQLELFSDGARAVAAAKRPKPPRPTEADLQARLDVARMRLHEIVILRMKTWIREETRRGLRRGSPRSAAGRPQGEAGEAAGASPHRHRPQHPHSRRRRHDLPAGLPHGSRGHRVETIERALPVRSVSGLAQGQEPGQPGDDPGTRRGVVVTAAEAPRRFPNEFSPSERVSLTEPAARPLIAVAFVEGAGRSNEPAGSVLAFAFWQAIRRRPARR